MINPKAPKDWRDLQHDVALILRESGFEVEIEKQIETVRGAVKIDVFAVDGSQDPEVTYLCECKQWRSAVPKTVVHAFRMVLGDYGANWGLIISSKGFQKGAYEAARFSNVKLLSWTEFQDLFEERWFRRYFMPQLHREADPLVEYTEPINSRIFRKADALDQADRERFKFLRRQYRDLAYLTIPFYPMDLPMCLPADRRPTLPLKNALSQMKEENEAHLPEDILEAVALREFLETFIKHIRKGIEEFDKVFGGRA